MEHSNWCGACWTMTDSNGDNIHKPASLKGTTHEFKFSADNYQFKKIYFLTTCVISMGLTNKL